jgi:cell division protein FtsL
MLNRTTLPITLPHHSDTPLRHQWLAEPTTGLVRFLLVLVLASALTCVYVWQASTIAAVEHDTTRLRLRLAELERQNTSLMLQLAQWNAPAYIEAQARQQGMIPVRQPRYVSLEDVSDTLSDSQPAWGGVEQIVWQWWSTR